MADRILVSVSMRAVLCSKTLDTSFVSTNSMAITLSSPHFPNRTASELFLTTESTFYIRDSCGMFHVLRLSTSDTIILLLLLLVP